MNPESVREELAPVVDVMADAIDTGDLLDAIESQSARDRQSARLRIATDALQAALSYEPTRPDAPRLAPVKQVGWRAPAGFYENLGRIPDTSVREFGWQPVFIALNPGGDQ